ncbi:MAG: LemA family protein [Spirulinaceae cyanobacterium SM2_1_0]|nr:LemA family protein [Spirulinaceae cyanobacterium SM2_1_0]
MLFAGAGDRVMGWGLLIALVVIIGVVASIVISSYNRLVTLRNRYQNAYAQIDVQLRRRYDLIPNLVETAKGYMKHERETFEAVIAARNAAMTANSQAASQPGDPSAMQGLAQAEAMLGGTLGRLFALAEAYPDLKADRTMTQLMEELTSTENRIAFARQAFNDGVTLYNTQREVFPSNIIAGMFNFQGAELLQEADPEVRSAPRVSF